MTKKTFILDTNVLLSDPSAIFSFGTDDVVLPFTVLEELDRQKTRPEEVGRNAREVVRKLFGIIEHQNNQDIKEGIPLVSGGCLRILSVDDLLINDIVDCDLEDSEEPTLTFGLPTELLGSEKPTGDNSILDFCLKIQQQEPVILVTRDVLLHLKAKSLGIECQEYGAKTHAGSLLYSGVTTLTGNFDIDKLHREDELWLTPEITESLYPNEFVILKNEKNHQSALVRFFEEDEPVVPVRETQIGKLSTRNKEQMFALDLLMDPSVKLVTLAGAAGTGKTVVCLAAGLEQVLSKKYKTLVVCRPIQPVGKDIGYLPGILSEKLAPWLEPIKDNLRFLLGHGGEKRPRIVENTLNLLFENGTIEIQAMTFIRGRSISNAFILIDEIQNINPHELKTILTRVGEGSKIVLTGDIEQIDSTSLDAFSNGLSVCVEKFKDQEIAGHVTLTKGERSLLATIASRIL